MKTLTMRVDETVYEMIKQAAKGQKRTIANFVEYATVQYLTSSQFVDNDEMEALVQDKELLANLRQGLDDVKNGDFTIV